MVGNLFAGEDETPIGPLAWPDFIVVQIGVIKSVNNQLPLDLNRFVLVVKEEQATAESLCRRCANRLQNIRGPDRDDTGRR